jgi:rare lipoprotein A
MRRLIAYGLALFLGLTSLGAAHRPDLSEASITKDQLNLQSKQTLAASRAMSSRNGHPYQVGTASWYGDYFQGKTTASGEPYDMNDLTAAHPSLPLGTRVRVTNLRNGRAVILRVNDRGPVVDGRIIDLSYGAAKILGMSGTGIQRVRLDLTPERRTKAAQAAIQHATISPALERQILARSLRTAQRSTVQVAPNSTPQTLAMLRQ